MLSTKEMDYTSLLYKYSDTAEDLVLITTEKEIENLGAKLSYTCGNGVLRYVDDISQEEVESNE